MVLTHSRGLISRAPRLGSLLCSAQCHRQWLSHRRMFTTSIPLGQESGIPPQTDSNRNQAGKSLKDRLRKGGRSPAGNNDIANYILGHPKDKPMRTRFAPSPTGDMHLGSLRTALINQVVAKSTKGGEFILRIEDTDQARLVESSQKTILEDLKWLGMKWEEGPDVGGPHGPYLQSERLHIYKPYVDKLMDQGHAYRCFCKPEDIERQKQAAHKQGTSTAYSKICRRIPNAESSERAANKEPHVVRFKGDYFGIEGFKDAIKGSFEKADFEDDFVIWKTDGFPTYHLANVVDDHLMHITHVIRGDEWLISTPKHLALYRALGWEPPVFGHLGLLFQEDGQKLSKRNRAASLQTYKDTSVLPSALAFWLASRSLRFPGLHGDKMYTIEEMSSALGSKISGSNVIIGDKASIPEKIELAALQKTIEGYRKASSLDSNASVSAPIQDQLAAVLKESWNPTIEEISRVTRQSETPSFITYNGAERHDAAAWKQDPTLVEPLRDLASRPAWSQPVFDHIVSIYNTIAHFKDRPFISLPKLAFTMPYLFWRPPLSLQRLWVAEATEAARDIMSESNAESASLSNRVYEHANASLLTKMYDPVDGYPDWEGYLQSTYPIGGDKAVTNTPALWALEQTGQKSDQETQNALHRQNRLMLTGGDRTAPPLKHLVPLIGLDECRARLRAVEGLYEELRVGGQDLAKAWIREGRALLRDDSPRL